MRKVKASPQDKSKGGHIRVQKTSTQLKENVSDKWQQGSNWDADDDFCVALEGNN